MLSKVGLGGVFLGGFRSPKKLNRLLSTAEELGINFVDLAPLYFKGRSEEMFGLADFSKRMKVILKCGVPYDGMKGYTGGNFVASRHATVPVKQWQTWFPPESLKFYLKTSLARVKRDNVEAFLLHSPPSNLLLGDYGHALLEIKAEGLCREVGFASDVERFAAEPWADIVQLPFQFADSGTATADQKLVLNGVLRESGFRLEEATALSRDIRPDASFLIGTGKTSHLMDFVKVFGVMDGN